ncbi:MAG: DUF4097 family beta strand repeat-containing protein [Thermoanaerobaculia bacterium]
MTRRFAMATITTLFALTLGAAAEAQVQIDRRRPAPVKGEVSIDSSFGIIRVHGWEKREVLVQGTLAAGVEDFSFDSDKEGTSISVDVPEEWLQATKEDPAFLSTIDVYVPAGSRVGVRTVNAAVIIDAVTGRVDVRSVNGGVQVSGPASAVEVETMTGAIEVHTLAAPMDIHSISGGVVIEGATGEVRVETVSGQVHVTGAGLTSLEVQTTTGTVDFHGAVAPKGSLEIETFSSPVTLLLPRRTPAVFDLKTFSGNIKSDFCAGTPVIRKHFEPFRELHCSTGPDDFEIQITTHDADITLTAE